MTKNQGPRNDQIPMSNDVVKRMPVAMEGRACESGGVSGLAGSSLHFCRGLDLGHWTLEIGH